MADDRLFTVRIMTPERCFYEGDVSMIEFTSTEGDMGILKGHIPMTVLLKPGVLTLTEENGKKQAALHSGFAEILQDRVTILAEIVEWPDEIDSARARAAMERAEQRIRNHEEGVDVRRAEAALARAVTRIQVLK